jgi:hypothetical protein
MQTLSRRQYLTALGGTGTLLLAGCVDDEEPEFVVTDTAFSIYEASDMDVLVTVENGYLDRRTGTIEVTVRHEPENGETEQWRQTEELELSGGTEIQRNFLFEDIYEEGIDLADYDVSAQLLDTEDGTND